MGNRSLLAKRDGESDLKFCDEKQVKKKEVWGEDDDDDSEQVEKLDPILSSLNYDIISEVISFLDVKNQLLVCSSSKILFNEFIGTESYNKHFYSCSTKYDIPSIHDISLLDHLFKRLKSQFHKTLTEEEMVVKFNRLWRKLLNMLVESQSFKFNPTLPSIVCEEDDYFVRYENEEGFGNFTFSMKIPQNITELYDSSQNLIGEKYFLLNFEIVKKEPNKNICIGLGDKEVLELNCIHRFLGFPNNSLSYSSDGCVRYRIVESLRDEFSLSPYKEGDIISMLIRAKPYTKGKEVFYMYQVNFFNNGHSEVTHLSPQFDSLCPLYPSFTFHSNGDAMRVLFSKRGGGPLNNQQHKILERIFAFLLKYNLFV